MHLQIGQGRGQAVYQEKESSGGLGTYGRRRRRLGHPNAIDLLDRTRTLVFRLE
jgi:hypothetical protein